MRGNVIESAMIAGAKLKYLIICLLLMVASSGLYSCGMKGELYLPDEKTESAPSK